MPTAQQNKVIADKVRAAMTVEINRLADHGNSADLKTANQLTSFAISASDSTMSRLYHLIVGNTTRAGALDELVGATENIGSVPA